MATMNLYCCGGAGMNIGQNFASYDGIECEGFATLKTYFIDGSRANLNESINNNNLYLFEGLNGSGKLRRTNYEEFSARGKDVLHTFPPSEDLNIVIHSTSGGTGSVCGAVIVAELLSRDLPVVIITVGSTGSNIEALNTINVLRSYEVIAQKQSKPTIMLYHENSVETPRQQVDGEVQSKIVKLAALFSGQNKELDREDLRNFMNYPRVTSFSPRLTHMEITNTMLPKVTNQQTVVAVATLADSGSSTELNELVDYHTTGFINEASKSKITGYASPMHYSLVVGYFNPIIESLESKKNAFQEKSQAYVDKGIAKGVTDTTSEGIIL